MIVLTYRKGRGPRFFSVTLGIIIFSESERTGHPFKKTLKRK